QIWGASSMGALRAAECHPLGMKGVGWIFEAFCRGEIVADDELALLFERKSGSPITLPLVNVRWALHCALDEGLIAPDDHYRVLQVARAIHFTERTYQRIEEAVPVDLRAAARTLTQLVAQDPQRFDRKRLDALMMLAVIARAEASGGSAGG